MNRKKWLLVLSVALIWAGLAGNPAPAEPPAWVADQLLVTVRPGVDRGRAEGLYKAHGAAIIDEIPQIHTHLIRVPPQALEQVEQALSRRPEVEAVQKNRRHPPGLVPNDPQYASQWHLPKIAAPQAWDYLDWKPEVTVAILDSGVDPTHPDLAANLVPGYNFYSNNTNTADVYGHGTKVAGAAAAVTDNDTGVASPAYQAFIMPIRVTGTDGWAYSSTLAQGLTWAADHGARVMNMSFGSVADDKTITSAAQYAMKKGAVVVAAAGNSGAEEPVPENPYMISVSATDSSDRLCSFSSRGAYVDLAAPGSGIYSTLSGGGYGYVSGTSFSSPIVAGVAAAVLAVNPDLTPQEVEGILEETAVDLGAAGYDTSFGHGRVNAGAAVARAAGFVPPPDPDPPTCGIAAPADGATVSGTVTVSVTATDNVGVVKVELYLDGQLFATDIVAPFSFAWNTAQAADGAHTLKAVAYDAAGNSGASPAVTVTVQNQTADVTPPEAAIVDPPNGATLTKVAKVKIRARDNVQVQRVEFYVDGVLSSAASASGDTVEVQFNLNPRKLAKGPHSLSALAWDAAGNRGASPPVAVSVK
jgi:thermitase